MCLAIPGRVEQITTDGDIRMGRVNFGGLIKNVCLDYVTDKNFGAVSRSDWQQGLRVQFASTAPVEILEVGASA